MPALSTVTFTWARTVLAALLGALGARPGAALLTSPTLVLITDSNPILPDDATANHTPANFSGYANDSITLGGVGNVGTDGVAEISNALWIAGVASPFVGNTITGYLLTDGATTFYGGELFQTPVVIAQTGDYVDLTLLMPVGFYEAAG